MSKRRILREEGENGYKVCPSASSLSMRHIWYRNKMVWEWDWSGLEMGTVWE